LHFAPDTELSLDFIVSLVNTEPGASRSGQDELATQEQLDELLTRYIFTGRIDRDEAELREVRQTRALVRRVWTLQRDDAAAEVNQMLSETPAQLSLARHDGLDWHLHATSPQASLAERIRIESALALTDVIRSDAMGRLRVCAADDCTGLLLDLSRNGSKRFCSVRCGNRMNMIAFRERKS
jgi:predicted RNA-binding Zn ribbon-like protein